MSSIENSHPNILRLQNDRFNTSTGNVTVAASNQNVQGFSVEISDMGITQAQFSTATELRVIRPSAADPPFIAYNTRLSSFVGTNFSEQKSLK